LIQIIFGPDIYFFEALISILNLFSMINSGVTIIRNNKIIVNPWLKLKQELNRKTIYLIKVSKIVEGMRQ
jgi:hypothetical protein